MAVALFIGILLCPMIEKNKVFSHVVPIEFWARECFAGPLIRRLAQIDPAREWTIALTTETQYANLPLKYYSTYGYKIQFPSSNENWDVLVMNTGNKKGSVALFDKTFFDQFGCYVAVNPKQWRNGPIPSDRITLIE
jgi:hypothetical protein